MKATNIQNEDGPLRQYLEWITYSSHQVVKFCIRNSEDRCSQCRDYAPRKRICPVYRIAQKQRREAVEKAKSEFREFLNVVKS